MLFIVIFLWSIIIFFTGAFCLDRQYDKQIVNKAEQSLPLVIKDKFYMVEEITNVKKNS